MEPKCYIEKELNKFVKLFPCARVRYEFDVRSSVHVIEVMPVAMYHSDSDYQQWEDNLFSEFVKRYPTENICFVSKDSLVGIVNPGFVAEGIEYDVLRPLTMDEIDGMLDEAETCFSDGKGISHEEVFRELRK